MSISINPTSYAVNAYISTQKSDTAQTAIQQNKPTNVDTFTFVCGERSATYEKYDNSFLRNVHDEDFSCAFSATIARSYYYSNLFSLSTEAANGILDHGIIRGQDGNWLNYKVAEGTAGYYTVEMATERYAELRDEVYKAFGHDGEALAKNLISLDRAFENHIAQIAQNVANHYCFCQAKNGPPVII